MITYQLTYSFTNPFFTLALGLNISVSRASSSNDKDLNGSSSKKKLSKKSLKPHKDADENHDDSKVSTVTPKLGKSKTKKKIPCKFFTDYTDYKTREVTCNGVTVVITEFRRKKEPKAEEDNNNSMSKNNLNFLNQIPKFDSGS